MFLTGATGAESFHAAAGPGYPVAVDSGSLPGARYSGNQAMDSHLPAASTPRHRRLTRLWAAACCATLILASISCGRADEVTVSPSGVQPQVTDLASLMGRMKAAGLKVSADGEAELLFFPERGAILSVDAESIQVFEYPNAEAAEGESSRISADGSEVLVPVDGNARVTKLFWESTPHFFRFGTIIALYVGDNPSITATLTEVMGPQFAGR